MPEIAHLTSYLVLAISIALFAIKAFALADCVGRKPVDFTLASTLPKRGWLLVLGLTLLAHVFSDWNPLGLLNVVGTVAAFVYLAQLRGGS